jgi:hypothetical protein
MPCTKKRGWKAVSSTPRKRSRMRAAPEACRGLCESRLPSRSRLVSNGCRRRRPASADRDAGAGRVDAKHIAVIIEALDGAEVGGQRPPRLRCSRSSPCAARCSKSHPFHSYSRAKSALFAGGSASLLRVAAARVTTRGEEAANLEVSWSPAMVRPPSDPVGRGGGRLSITETAKDTDILRAIISHRFCAETRAVHHLNPRRPQPRSRAVAVGGRPHRGAPLGL